MQQAPKPNKPTIPEPTAEVEGLYHTSMALKQAVEGLMASRPSLIVSLNEPPVEKDGDFWLCKGGTATSLSVAVNGAWLVVWP